MVEFINRIYEFLEMQKTSSMNCRKTNGGISLFKMTVSMYQNSAYDGAISVPMAVSEF